MIVSTSLYAQQNGVQHKMMLAELTYGETITAMAPAPGGEMWVGGNTCSTTLPTTPGAIQPSWTGVPCIAVGFIARMKPDGTIVYLSYWGGSSDSNGPTEITSLATDASGDLFIAGATSSLDFVTTSGAYDRTCGKGTCGPSKRDGFVTKVSPDGSTVIFSTYLGGSGDDVISSIAVDASGQVHVTGSTTSSDFPVTAGALQSSWAAGFDSTGNPFTDAFYARLSSDGSALEYGTYLGGSSVDVGNGVALDASGDAYVVGTTYSTDFPTLNPAQSASANAFLATFGASGPVYSTYVGGTNGKAVAVSGSFAYITGSNGSLTVAEVAGATGVVTRSIAMPSEGQSEGLALAVDSNHIAYVTGDFLGNDCALCGEESFRYPTTWDAFQRSTFGGHDAVLSIIDFETADPTVRYSTMLGGGENFGLAVMPDGAGGAYFAGLAQTLQPVNGQPAPPKDPAAADDAQSFVAHVDAEAVTLPAPPADIVLYAYDPNGITPTAITGKWKIEEDTTAAGGEKIHEPDQGVPKITTPAANQQSYFELEFLAQANVPYHLWFRMRADGDSYLNDSVWVQFSDSVDSTGNPIWRIHSTDGTFVSLEDCTGCGEQAWGWNDNGYGAPGVPVMFATSGWQTIRIQQREDGIAIDQIVLSSSTWLNTRPGANKNDTTILPETTLVSSSGVPPTVSITSPSNGATFTAHTNITITAAASDSDGTVTQVQFYENGSLIGTSTVAPFSISWNDVTAGNFQLTAIATDNVGATTTSSAISVSVSSTALPLGWFDVDIGATGAKGSATYPNSTFVLQGAGADVWGTSDAFHYDYLALPGDGWIVARVASVSNQANWVKAGVMIRNSLDPSAAQAFMLVSYAKGVAFQRRTADGGTTVSTPGSASTAPRWVKLVRTGSTITGYESVDGVSWTLVGSDTFSMGTSAVVGLAVSSHVVGTLAMATFDSISTSPLPDTWVDSDVGAVPIRGSAQYDGNTVITGSGADIWGSSDAFHFAYTALTGDGTIVAQVVQVQNVTAWVKAGVMIRETLDPGSAHAFMLVSAGKGVAFQRRDIAGGTSVSTAGSASIAPHWVKLTRSGNTFAAYESDDGLTWTEVGTDTIPMATTVYIGLAVTSHTTDASATCVFEHVSFD